MILTVESTRGCKLVTLTFARASPSPPQKLRSARRRTLEPQWRAPADLLHTIESRTRADQPTQQNRSDDDLCHVAGLLADQASEWQRRVFEQKLTVHDDLAEEDARPPPQSPEIERADAQPNGRPDGRHRRRIAKRLPELRRSVVGSGKEEDTGHVPEGSRSGHDHGATEYGRNAEGVRLDSHHGRWRRRLLPAGRRYRAAAPTANDARSDTRNVSVRMDRSPDAPGPLFRDAFRRLSRWIGALR
jgi:hypothetical protein